MEGWASLVSYVVARTYVPQSPFRFAGWSYWVAFELRRIAALFERVLQAIARAVGAAGFSVGLSFPWGVTVSLDWTTP
ncbi:hypothetical protein GCM10010273_27650 [Streptomyces lavendulocolor]